MPYMNKMWLTKCGKGIQPHSSQDHDIGFQTVAKGTVSKAHFGSDIRAPSA